MRWIPLTLFVVTGCAHSSLAPEQAARLIQPADGYGSRIYAGTVTPKGEGSPALRYERRVLVNADGTRTSTHVTWTMSSDEPVVVQRARQDETGRLLAFAELNGQRGKAFHHSGGDVVVGPTMFEFVRTHLPELRAGRSVPLVFWSAGSGYDFTLTLTHDDTVEMRAASFFVGLAVAPMQFKLGAGDEVVSYHGRIPALFNGREVDADVTYEYFEPFR